MEAQFVPGTNKPSLSLGQSRGRRAAERVYVLNVYVPSLLPNKIQKQRFRNPGHLNAQEERGPEQHHRLCCPSSLIVNSWLLGPDNCTRCPWIPQSERQNHTGLIFEIRWCWISHWETKGRFRKRVVSANVPSFRFSFRGNMRTYPRSGFRSGGTSECTLVPVFRSGETSAKTTLFINPWFGGPEFQNFWNAFSKTILCFLCLDHHMNSN